MPNQVLFIVRGLPGSGRTTAVNSLRAQHPGIRHIDADPPLEGVAFSAPEPHEESLRAARVTLASLVADQSGEAVAVETCTPHAGEIEAISIVGRTAGYSTEYVEPAAPDASSPLSCAGRSAHKPTPSFIRKLVATWQPNPSLVPPDPRAGLRRRQAFTAFLDALAQPSHEAASAKMSEVMQQFPQESVALRLAEGPQWGRALPLREMPAFALADVSPYWRGVRSTVASIIAGHQPPSLPPAPTPSIGLNPAH